MRFDNVMNERAKGSKAEFNGAKFHGSASFNKKTALYLASFEDIRRLQDHLWERARSEGVAVIDNDNVDDTLAQLMQLVLDAVQEAQ